MATITAQLIDKVLAVEYESLHSCARRVLAKDAADRIVAFVENLQQWPNCDELMTLVRT